MFDRNSVTALFEKLYGKGDVRIFFAPVHKIGFPHFYCQ